ncbi:unnamed protein product [Phytophthora fragariaefolia]|uniref:Unnamed protein product n=1 Tax=Phytophthora fragariaefolia TaxID=1490495 RepID=A0A9W6U047_9STRA|nr:unnamed protein product [Phytophthora fragariaefolia]
MGDLVTETPNLQPEVPPRKPSLKPRDDSPTQINTRPVEACQPPADEEVGVLDLRIPRDIKDPDQEPRPPSPTLEPWLSRMMARSRASSECPTDVSFEEGHTEGSAYSDAADCIDGSLSQVPSELATGNFIVGSEGFRKVLAHTHFPWFDLFCNALTTGYKKADQPRSLYHCTGLEQVKLRKHCLVPALEHEVHLIDLFLRRRYYKCMRCPTFNKTIPPSPASLTGGWNVFAKTHIDKKTSSPLAILLLEARASGKSWRTRTSRGLIFSAML